MPRAGSFEVVLGMGLSDYDKQTSDNKTRPNNWSRQFARKVGPGSNSFTIL